MRTNGRYKILPGSGNLGACSPVNSERGIARHGLNYARLRRSNRDGVNRMMAVIDPRFAPLIAGLWWHEVAQNLLQPPGASQSCCDSAACSKNGLSFSIHRFYAAATLVYRVSFSWRALNPSRVLSSFRPGSPTRKRISFPWFLMGHARIRSRTFSYSSGLPWNTS